MGVGDVDLDENNFGDVVVDRRWKLLELDGVVDESDEATPATRTILPDNRIARKRRQAGVVAQLRFLETCDEHIVTRKKVIEFCRRIADSVTIPGVEALGRRTTTRTRVWVDAPDEEEDEDEATRERVCVDEDVMSERVDEPLKFRQWHHTGLKPLPEKGETLGMLAAILYIPASCWDSDPILRGIRRPHPA